MKKYTQEKNLTNAKFVQRLLIASPTKEGMRKFIHEKSPLNVLIVLKNSFLSKTEIGMRRPFIQRDIESPQVNHTN